MVPTYEGGATAEQEIWLRWDDIPGAIRAKHSKFDFGSARQEAADAIVVHTRNRYEERATRYRKVGGEWIYASAIIEENRSL